MESEITKSKFRQEKRKVRVRKSLKGSSVKPRLCVVKSNQHIHVQVIDDENSKTLCGLSTNSKAMKEKQLNKKSKAAAKELGEQIAGLILGQNINKVVFDRGSSKYHGILAAVADAAREKGLQF